MNLGVERFLILGCIAVLIVEVPQLMRDWSMGDGFVAEAVAVPALVVKVETIEAGSAPLAATRLEEQVLLPAIAGL